MTSTELIINYIDILIVMTGTSNDSVSKTALLTLNNVREYALQCQQNDNLNHLITNKFQNNEKENQ